MGSGSALGEKLDRGRAYAQRPGRPADNANSRHAIAIFKARQEAKVGGWTETRPVSLGLLPSGPDPVGEWLVHRQPPVPISAGPREKAR